MAAGTRNPDVFNTAARHVAKALCKVHPLQRAELLRNIILHAEAGLSVIETGKVPEAITSRWFRDDARDLIGVDLAGAA